MSAAMRGGITFVVPINVKRVTTYYQRISLNAVNVSSRLATGAGGIGFDAASAPLPLDPEVPA